MKTTTENTLTSQVLQEITSTAVEGLTTAAGSMSTAVTNLTQQISGWANNLSTTEFELGDDLVSLPGYGGRVLKGPEGSIKLNDDDTIIAGTDLMGGNENRNTQQIMGNLPDRKSVV